MNRFDVALANAGAGAPPAPVHALVVLPVQTGAAEVDVLISESVASFGGPLHSVFRLPISAASINRFRSR